MKLNKPIIYCVHFTTRKVEWYFTSECWISTVLLSTYTNYVEYTLWKNDYYSTDTVQVNTALLMQCWHGTLLGKDLYNNLFSVFIRLGCLVSLDMKSLECIETYCTQNLIFTHYYGVSMWNEIKRSI